MQAEALRSENETLSENLSTLKNAYDNLKIECDQVTEMLSNCRQRPDFDTSSSMSPGNYFPLLDFKLKTKFSISTARFSSAGENMADAIIEVQLMEKDEEIQALVKELDSLRARLEEVDQQLVSKDHILNVEKEKNLLLSNNNCELESVLTQCRVDLNETQKANDTFQSTVEQLTAERSSLQV